MRQCSWTSDPRCCASHFPLRRWSSSRPFLSSSLATSAHAASAAFARTRTRRFRGRNSGGSAGNSGPVVRVVST
jgi:hypothetical protein